MCFGGSRTKSTPAPAPVANPSPIGEDLAPELKTADETVEVDKKKKKAKGTKSLQTTAGVNYTGGSSLNIPQ